MLQVRQFTEAVRLFIEEMCVARIARAVGNQQMDDVMIKFDCAHYYWWQSSSNTLLQRGVWLTQVVREVKTHNEGRIEQ